MINSIIEAISISLNGEFGDDYEIYTEEIEQDLKESCFFIQCVDSTQRLFFGKRYLRQNQFCIQYFPERVDYQRECNEIAERIIDKLEYITVDNYLLRGTKMKYEMINGVLNFFVNFDCFIYKSEHEETSMEDYQTDNMVKNESR